MYLKRFRRSILWGRSCLLLGLSIQLAQKIAELTTVEENTSGQQKSKKIVWYVLAVVGGAAVLFFLFSSSGTTMNTLNNLFQKSAEPPAGEVLTLANLQNKVWQWEQTVYQGKEDSVAKPALYTLQFNEDMTVYAKIDCNNGSGSYEASEPVYSSEAGYYGSIRFGPMATTLMACGNESRADDMLDFINAVQNYRLENDGNTLVLIWPAGGPEEYFRNFVPPKASNVSGGDVAGAVDSQAGANPLNTTYYIEGQAVTLVDGKASVPAAPGSASTVDTSIWDPNYATGDLDYDGVDDAAVILVQNTGGSGSFYYVAAAMTVGNDGTATSSDDTVSNVGVGVIGTNAILLGDSIAMQNYSIADEVVTVNYADRPEDAPMTEQPSVGVSRRFGVDGVVLEELD